MAHQESRELPRKSSRKVISVDRSSTPTFREDGCQAHALAPGDYAHIPAGTVHAYALRSHQARLLSLTSKGEVGQVYARIGTATDLHVHPPHGEAAPKIFASWPFV